MEEELKSLVKVCVSAIISVSYCYYISSKIKSCVLRLLSVLPVCVLNLFLPLLFSFSIFSSTAAFFLSGTATLKLILFAFDQGPLYPLPHNLLHFICFTCFPIKLQQNPKPKNQNIPIWVFAIKVALLGLLFNVRYSENNMPRILLLGLFSLYLYLVLDVLLRLLRALLTITLGCDLEPHFNEPYLATSLQDFWGRRWNLMVTDILRLCIYSPVRRVCERIMSSYWATIIGCLTTFLFSGLFHEIIFFYINNETPKWEATSFFALHGVCTVIEVLVKRKIRWRLSPMVSRLITVGFLVVTGGLMFFPAVERSNGFDKCADEALLVFGFLKRKALYFIQF